MTRPAPLPRRRDSRDARLALELLEPRHMLATTPQLVADIHSGQYLGTPMGQFAEMNGALYLALNDGTYGCELWKVASPFATPQRVTDINSSTPISAAQ